jgi:hypothetical protein
MPDDGSALALHRSTGSHAVPKCTVAGHGRAIRRRETRSIAEVSGGKQVLQLLPVVRR